MTAAEQPVDTTAPQRRTFGPGSLVLLGGLVLIGVVLALALYERNQTQPTSGPAPDFTITTYTGDSYTLSAQRGKVVVVNFWASWCGPCRDEAPALEATWERYRDKGVEIIGIAYLETSDDTAKSFIGEFGLTYPSGTDYGSRIAKQYNIQGVPETFVVDQNGNVRQFFMEPINEVVLSNALDPLLQEGSSSQ